MPNRYANLTPSAKISQEYTKITEGFDKVQQEMDQQIAKSNDLQSQITNERQSRIAADQAHQNSTAAHPAEHITYSGKVSGATNVKQAADKLNDRIDNIVAQGGSDNTEVVDARMGADGVARPTLGSLVREIHRQQLDAARQSVTLKHGQNIVTTDQASPAEIIVKGRMMVNLLGSVGNCESLEPFTLNESNGIELSQERYRSGQYAIKFSAPGSARYVIYNSNVALDKSKCYLLAAWVYVESLTGNGTVLASLRDYGTQNARYITQISMSDVGKWKLLYVKIPTNNELVGNGFTLLFGMTGDSPTGVAYFDEVRIYEITQEEYNAIGVSLVSDDDIDAKYPYVDGLQSIVNPVITKRGKNLLPPFTDPAWSYTLPNFTNIKEPYLVELGSTTQWAASDIDVPALPNQAYTISFEANTRTVMRVEEIGDAGAVIKTPVAYTTAKKASFTTSGNTKKLRVRFTNGTVSGIFTVSNPQLELGPTATPFEPRNDDYIYAECTLRSLPNGVRDVLDVNTKIKFVGQVLLNGSENWSFFTTGEGHSSMAIPGWQNANNAVRFYWVNPNAALATNDEFASIPIDTGGNIFPSIGVASNGALVLYLPTTYSSASEFKAYLAEHPITLVYQLANPVTETVPVEGSVALHDGANIIEVGEGAIREKVNFDISTKRADLSQRSARVLAVHKNADPVAFTTYTSDNSVQPQLLEDVDPDAEYTVWYQALDRYDMTANVVDVAVTYKTNQKTVVDGLVQDMADAKTEISIHDRILAEYAARLLALEEGV